MPILTEFLEATPTAELEPLAAAQSDEVDMGVKYSELGTFGCAKPLNQFTAYQAKSDTDISGRLRSSALGLCTRSCSMSGVTSLARVKFTRRFATFRSTTVSQASNRFR